MGQVQRRALQAIVDPGQAGIVEGVGEHADGLALVLDRDELAFEALCQADLLEQRRAGEQCLAVEYGVMEGGAQALGEGGGVVAGKARQAAEQAFVTGLQAGLGQQFAG